MDYLVPLLARRASTLADPLKKTFKSPEIAQLLSHPSGVYRSRPVVRVMERRDGGCAGVRCGSASDSGNYFAQRTPYWPTVQSELITASSARQHSRPYGRQAPSGLLVGIALVALWLVVDPRTPDLAAQIYRVSTFSHVGAIVFDERWYAGHLVPGYSLLFPLVAANLGIRLTAAICVIGSCALFERVAVYIYGPAGRSGGVLFAIAATGDIWSGRLTFAAGVTFALASALAVTKDRALFAAALALLCAAFSPVAALLLALAVLTYALASRSLALPAAVIVPVLVLVGSTALLFGEGGFEPYPILSFIPTAAVTLAFYCALPGPQRTLRLGAILYLALCVACLLVHTPMGSNIERYGVLLAAPLLTCTLCVDPRRITPARLVALTGVLVWVLWGPVRETTAVVHNPSTQASYYIPVERFLATHGGGLIRIEVPLTRSHWEAALLAPHVSLAGGWEKQLQERYDSVLLSKQLSASAYDRWLHQQAVSYVALPDAPLDPSSAREGALIRSDPSFLRLVFKTRHWLIYQVLDPTPLLSGPGALIALGHDSFTVHATHAGDFVVRIHYTRYWTLTQGHGCVAQTPEGWTALRAVVPGRIVLTARFSFRRALFGAQQVCRG